MKKILIIVVAFLVTFSSAFAFAKWSTYKALPDGSYQELGIEALKADNVKIFKFQDDNNVCYVIYPFYSNGSGNPSMQCKIN